MASKGCRRVADAVITVHAATEIQRRGLDLDTVRMVLADPEQALGVRPGRIVVQSRVSAGHRARTYLVRVFVDIDRQPPEVVTVYRTSKVDKYWRPRS